MKSVRKITLWELLHEIKGLSNDYQWLLKSSDKRLMWEFYMEGSGCHHLNPVDQTRGKRITKYWVPSGHTTGRHSPACRKILEKKMYFKKVTPLHPSEGMQGLSNFSREARNQNAFVQLLYLKILSIFKTWENYVAQTT